MTTSVPGPAVRFRALKLAAAGVQRSWPVRLMVGLLFPSVIPFRATRIRPASRFSAEGPMLLFGNYERREIEFIHRYLPPDQQVIELGASIGAASCQICRRLAPSVPMICVEANPELIPVLRENLERNAPRREIQVMHGLVCDVQGTRGIQISKSSLTSAAGEVPGAIGVPAVRLADVLAHAGPGSFSLVCDIEGAEVSFLGNPDGVLDRCTCLIVEGHSAEFRGSQLSVEQVLSLPLQSGAWEQVARYGAVAAFRRVSPRAS